MAERVAVRRIRRTSLPRARDVSAPEPHPGHLAMNEMNGEMAERFKAQSWKDCLLERVTRVQIPISPFSRKGTIFVLTQTCLYVIDWS